MVPRKVVVLVIGLIAVVGGGAIAIAKFAAPSQSSAPIAAQTQSIGSGSQEPDLLSPRENLGLLAQADGKVPGEHPGRDKRWLRDLNLSKEQIEKIRTIRMKYRDRLGQQRQALQQAHKEFETAMAGDVSAEAVRQKYTQVKTLKQQVGDAQFEGLLEMREVLTPAQRQKFAEQMQQRRQKIRGRMMNPSEP